MSFAQDNNKGSRLMAIWRQAIIGLAKLIYNLKQRSRARVLVTDIPTSLIILVLEIALAVISLPFYFTKDFKQRPKIFNQAGYAYCTYRVRKRATLSTAGSAIFFIVLYAVISIANLFYLRPTHSAIITWDGGGTDSNWSTAGNWSNDTVPTSTDGVVFDGTSIASAVIDAGFSGRVASLQIAAGYTGTITQSRSLSVSGNFAMAGGIFAGGSADIDIDGNFSHTSGVFNATSGAFSVAGNFSQTGGTFNHPAGAITFDGMGAQELMLSATTTLASLKIDGPGNRVRLSDAGGAGGVLEVIGVLDLRQGYWDSQSSGGASRIYAQGQITSGPMFAGGTGIVVIAGPARTITLRADGYFPNLEIYDGSSLDLSGTGTTTFSGISIKNGTVSANSAQVRVAGALTVSGAGAVYTGGAGNDQIDGGVTVTNHGSVNFGGGQVMLGGNNEVANESILNLENAAQVNFSNETAGVAANYLRLQTGGLLAFPPATVYFPAGEWSHAGGGVFYHNNGTVIFNGGDQKFANASPAPESTAFYNFIKIASTTNQFLYLPDYATPSFAGALTLRGAGGNLLYLESNTDGVQGQINPQGSVNISNVNLYHVKNTGPAALEVTGKNVIDGGGDNQGWLGLVDNTAPQAPGALAVDSVTENAVTVRFGGAGEDPNLVEHRIYYRAGTGVSTSSVNQVFTSSSDPALGLKNFGGGVTAKISGLSPSREHSVRIYAFDSYGNSSAASETTFYTRANPPGAITLTDVGSDFIFLSWDTSGNSATSTQYYVEDANNAATNSAWISQSNFQLTSLTAKTVYSLRVKARNRDQVESVYTSMNIPTTTLAAGVKLALGQAGLNKNTSSGGSGTGQQSPSIQSEPIAPVASPLFLINNGSEETTSTIVRLTFFADNAVEMAIASTSAFLGADFQPYATSSRWLLPNQYGKQFVYVRFKFADGSRKEVSDFINLVAVPSPAEPAPVGPAGQSVTQEPVAESATASNEIVQSCLDYYHEGCDQHGVAAGEGGRGILKIVALDRNKVQPVKPADTEKELVAKKLKPAEKAAETVKKGLGIVLEKTKEAESKTSALSGSVSDFIEERASVAKKIVSDVGEAVAGRVDRAGVIDDRYTSAAQDFLTQAEERIRLSQVAGLSISVQEALPALAESARESVEQVKKAALAVQKVADDPQVETVAKKVVVPVSVGASTIALFPILAQTAVPLLRFMFFQPLLFLGLKKRRSWGMVYNSLNKLPVDLAIVRLVDARTNLAVQSRVTDGAGRFMFLASAGSYRIEVRKPGFVFPSQLLKEVQTDGRRLDLYHGDELVAAGAEMAVAPNIPIDPVGAGQTPKRILFNQYLLVTQNAVAMTGIAATGLAMYVNPSWQIAGFLGTHVVLVTIFKKYVKPRKPRHWGTVTARKTGQPVARAIVRLYTDQYGKLVETKITDSKGHYAFLVGSNRYYLVIEKSGYAIFKTKTIEVSAAEQSFIAADISLLAQRRKETERPASDAPKKSARLKARQRGSK